MCTTELMELGKMLSDKHYRYLNNKRSFPLTKKNHITHHYLDKMVEALYKIYICIGTTWGWVWGEPFLNSSSCTAVASSFTTYSLKIELLKKPKKKTVDSLSANMYIILCAWCAVLWHGGKQREKKKEKSTRPWKKLFKTTKTRGQPLSGLMSRREYRGWKK